MKKVILTKGLPASGKTTWAKNLVNANPGQYKRVNKDDLREMLDCSKWSRDNEKMVLAVRDQIIRHSLIQGKHVIIDDTNLAQKHENHIRELVSAFNKDNEDNVIVEIQSFDITVEEAIKRDLKRPISVGAKVIRDMYDQFVREKTPVNNDSALPWCVLVDIDGTVAKMNDRGPFEWDKVHTDLPHSNIIRAVHGVQAIGSEVIFLSGRDGSCRGLTQQWLDRHFSFEYKLFMRPAGDNRKDTIVKKEMFMNEIHGKYYVDMVFDDRQQVVDMWRRELGLVVLQVDYGDF